MTPNPALGVFFHWLGGLASGSFYVPFRGVKKWAWETYWLVGGFFSWIIVPWLLASLLTNDLEAVLRGTSSSTLFWAYFFGFLWGIGNATFGLTMRYLGMSLGMAVALGYCAAFGTLMPPIFNGVFASQVLGTQSGLVILLGVGVCLAGIACCGLAGISKEREMSAEQKQAVIKEFNLKKGLMVATVSGILSACFSYGLAAGDPIKELTMAHGTGSIWQGLPVLVVVLLGGFTSNFLWCAYLNWKNRTGYQYFTSTLRPEHVDPKDGPDAAKVPVGSNLFFCALAGTTWYMQFFFYSMGETKMGAYKFSSWTLHMASIIIFSTLWGVALHEWRGASRRTIRLVVLSLAVLIASTIVVGYGNYLGADMAAH
jgi:L-rhamnose-H+ transport protein